MTTTALTLSAAPHLPLQVRPRERLLAHGPEALADAELLAILLRTGVAGRPVLMLADDMLRQQGGFAGLLCAELKVLKAIRGLGPTKCSVLSAVMEIARRALRQTLTEAPVFESVQSVRQYLRLQLDALRVECFAVLFLDIRHRLITMEKMSMGTLSHTIAYPREVVKRALALEAAAVILAHNHPSGSTSPSPEDIRMTRAMTEALALVDVKVLDHFIIGAGDIVSMADQGYL